MVDFDKKKKQIDFSTDFDRIDELVEKIMEKLSPKMPGDSSKPVVFGFSMRIDNGGKPVIEEFGTNEKKGKNAIVGRAREPLVDVSVAEKNVLITVELPGVDKDSLKINVPGERIVEVIVSGGNSFYKKILVPVEIKKEKASAKLNNGVLEICFERKEEEESGGEIKIT